MKRPPAGPPSRGASGLLGGQLAATPEPEDALSAAEEASAGAPSIPAPPAEDEASGGLRECPLCLLPQPAAAFPELSSCAHLSCLTCLQQYLRIAISQSRVQVACPHCPAPLQPAEVHQLLRPEPALRDKYEEYLLRRLLVADPGTRWCPAPDCSGGLGGAPVGPPFLSKRLCLQLRGHRLRLRRVSAPGLRPPGLPHRVLLPLPAALAPRLLVRAGLARMEPASAPGRHGALPAADPEGGSRGGGGERAGQGRHQGLPALRGAHHEGGRRQLQPHELHHLRLPLLLALPARDHRRPLPQSFRLHLLGEEALVAHAEGPVAAGDGAGRPDGDFAGGGDRRARHHAGHPHLHGQEGVGVPLMLTYVYGVVVLSLCRNRWGCGGARRKAGELSAVELENLAKVNELLAALPTPMGAEGGGSSAAAAAAAMAAPFLPSRSSGQLEESCPKGPWNEEAAQATSRRDGQNRMEVAVEVETEPPSAHEHSLCSAASGQSFSTDSLTYTSDGCSLAGGTTE